MLGLPDQVTACLFDLDGVLTDTASVHDTAWTETFNAFLKARAGQHRHTVRAVRLRLTTTTSTSTASPAPTASARSCTVAASSYPRASPTTVRTPRPSTAWVTARTCSCSNTSSRTA